MSKLNHACPTSEIDSAESRVARRVEIPPQRAAHARRGRSARTRPCADPAKRLALLLALVPFAYMTFGFLFGRLGANPVEALTRDTGLWSLRLLWLTLALTPLRKFSGWQWPARIRRILALSCFFYACLHLFVYLVFEHEFDFPAIADEMAKRPYVALGFFCFLLLTPLALTSTDAMMKRMGGANWRILHRLTYIAAIAAALHYLLLVKRDIAAPALYILILAALFQLRMSKFSFKLQDLNDRLGCRLPGAAHSEFPRRSAAKTPPARLP